MMTIFEPQKKLVEPVEDSGESTPQPDNKAENKSESSPENADSETRAVVQPPERQAAIEVFKDENGALILSETDAITELSAIPLYFPTSYSLVKPYILGFETNALDAPLLREVRIDNAWQPKENKGESK
jgi:hypothetical protein